MLAVGQLHVGECYHLSAACTILLGCFLRWPILGMMFLQQPHRDNADRDSPIDPEAEIAMPGIDWYVNPSYIDHQGRIWESLIRSVKRIVMSPIKQETIDDDTLSTMLTKFQRMLNNRPLRRLSHSDITRLA